MIALRRAACAVAAIIVSVATPARAAWFEATTNHFIVEADAPDERVRDFAMRLEKFDRALHLLYGVEDDPSRKSNRVQVFAAGADNVRRMCGPECPDGVAGFYHSEAGGSVIFTSMLSGAAGGPDDLSPQAVLLHEYSHHFMYSNFPIAYPFWFSEGFAEFNANVTFDADGSIVLGLPANYRAWNLNGGLIYDDAHGVRSQLELTISQLLDPPDKLLKDPGTLDLIYGKGWLLTNYLMLNAARRSQLDIYLKKMNEGASSLDAAKAAFGDVRQLGIELARYLAGHKLFPPFRVPPPDHPVSIEMRALSRGEAAIMPAHMRSTAGVTLAAAHALIDAAERAAAPYPDDPKVQDQLAEAEFDADNDASADAAADRALKSNPGDIRALLYKGRVAIRRARQLQAKDAATWSAARAWYVRANRADPNAARPLLLYYQSFLAERRTPPDAAVLGLGRAEVLAPEDSTVRELLAEHMLMTNDAVSARYLLQPIAFAPHERVGQNIDKEVIGLIDAGKIEDARRKLAAAHGDSRPDEGGTGEDKKGGANGGG